MKILALDTATETGGVALLEDELLLGQCQFRTAKTHTHLLWKAILFLLEQTNSKITDLDLWAVTVGPGSFTGLRIGLATVKGLAFATGKPVVGLSTLEVLAAGLPYSPLMVCPLIDARKKEVFYAFYRLDKEGKRASLGQARNNKPQQVVEAIKEPVILVGNGALLYRDFFQQALGEGVFFPEPPFHIISPFILGHLAYQRFKLDGPAPLDDICPFYVRPSDAELKTASAAIEPPQITFIS
jgi:tRNA threonylcarbamoyladenosine biosynthesis protein TsaB